MFSKFLDYFNHKDKKSRSNRWVFIAILITSTLGLLAAFVLSIDAFELLKNPGVRLSCNINSIISCGTVASTSYASIFGFPNSFIGLIGEPIFITVAIAGLYGVRFPRQFMFAVHAAALFSLLFAYYLFHISVFVIHALCPWCLLVDVSTIVMFFAITRYNINEDNLYLSKKISVRAKTFIQKDYDKFAAALLIVLGIAIIIAKFGKSLFA
jgi:uncharacterized membrane protein